MHKLNTNCRGSNILGLNTTHAHEHIYQITKFTN